MLHTDAEPMPLICTSVLCTGLRTPHSQLRQVSLGLFVVLSLTSLPQALSERFAEPTYAQAGQPEASFDVDATRRRAKSI